MTREDRIAYLMTKRDMTIEKSNAIIDRVDAPAPVIEVQKFILTAEQETTAIAYLNGQRAAMARVSDYRTFRTLYTVMVYEGATVCARRNQVDGLDNVTIWRK